MFNAGLFGSGHWVLAFVFATSIVKSASRRFFSSEESGDASLRPDTWHDSFTKAWNVPGGSFLETEPISKCKVRDGAPWCEIVLHHPCQCDRKCSSRNDCCDEFALVCAKFNRKTLKKSSLGRSVDELTLNMVYSCAIPTAVFFILLAWFFTKCAVNYVNYYAYSDHTRHITSVETDANCGMVNYYFCFRFSNPTMEAAYYQWNQAEQIKTSSRVIFFMLFLFLVLLLVETIVLAAAGPECETNPENLTHGVNKQRVAIIVSEFLVLFFLLLFAMKLIFRPKKSQFYPLLIGTLTMVFLANMPPTKPSCAFTVGACKDSKKLKNMRLAMDCTLFGITSVQKLLVFLFMAPWMMPKHEDVHMLWFWLLGMFLCWSFEFDAMTDVKVMTDTHKTHRFMFLALAVLASTSARAKTERENRRRFYQEAATRKVGMSMFGIVNDMMPGHVVIPMMKNPGGTIAESAPTSSILFILIDDFHTITSSMTPTELLAFLNGLFTKIDSVMERHGVSKIETVGEEYVAAVGVLPEHQAEQKQFGHGPLLERLFLAADEILSLKHSRGVAVKMKMGVQTGPVIAGVVGKKLPRYRLFGDTVNSAARMMQKGMPGAVQLGAITRQHLPSQLVDRVEYRGEVEMKGKGKIPTWLFSRSEDCSGPPLQSMFMSIRKPAQLPKIGEKDSETDSIGKHFGGIRRSSGFGHLENEVTYALKTKKSREFEEALAETSQDGGSYSFWEVVPPEMYEEWRLRFHADAFGDRRLKRLSVATLAMILITGVDYYFGFIHGQAHRYAHPIFDASLRGAWFILLRGAMLFLYAFNWWLGTTFVQKCRPNVIQPVFLSFDIVVLFCAFLSYSAIGFTNTVAWRKQMTTLMENDKYMIPQDQEFALHIVLLNHVILHSNKFRVFQSAALVPTVLLCMWLHSIFNSAAKEVNSGYELFGLHSKIILLVQVLLRVITSLQAENQHKALFKAQHRVRMIELYIQRVLGTLLPPLVVEEMVGKSGPSHVYRHCCIAQSDLCGFTQLSATKSPSEIVSFMGELFGRFDDLSDAHGVYKVETVGDAYIVAMAEPPLTVSYSPSAVVVFSLDAVRAVDEWAMGLNAQVTCRVGVHYGECIGGIVGTRAQRYHLFGETMQILEILESTSVEGRVQVSSSCRLEVARQLRDHPKAATENISFTLRTDRSLKTSKGEIHEYTEVGGPTFLVHSDRALRHIPMIKRYS